MKYLKLFIVALVALAVACTPDEPALGEKQITAEELLFGRAYTVAQDTEDPNTIYLKSLVQGCTPLWIHPQGRSQEAEVTLQIPFKGSYTIQFGVMTRGGAIYGEPFELELVTDNLKYVDDPMWNLLAGGPGEEKSWVLDIDAEGVSRYFIGPVYFRGLADWYGSESLGLDPLPVYKADGSVDSWSWDPDFAGNDWVLADKAIDYGTMTFDLKDGAHVRVENLATGRTETGSYMIDKSQYTLRFTDASMLHDSDEGKVADWGDTRIMRLTENTLQLGVKRIEDPCLLVYNFISKEYRDNWVPTEPEVPVEPVLPDNWESIVGQITQTSIKWTLSHDTPLNWCAMNGTFLNDWNSAADYPDWLGTPDPSLYGGFSLTMDSSAKSYTAVAPDGTTVEGLYTLDEKGIYTFDQPLPSFTVINWASFAADGNNQLRIMQVNTKADGSVSDMWVGAKAADKEEYMAYHLVANAGGNGETEEPEEPEGFEASIYFTTSSWWPSGNGPAVQVTGDGSYTCTFDVGVQATDCMVFTVDIKGLREAYPFSSARVKAVRLDGAEYPFDPAKVIYGDLEANGNLRMEFRNEYYLSKNDPAIDPANFTFTTLEVDFEVKFEACQAKIMLINQGWWPSFSDTPTAGILGVGKHLVSSGELTDHITVPMIFCLDVVGYPVTEQTACGIHAIKVNGSEVGIKPEKLRFGDLENNGNLRFEFFNIYGGTGGGSTDSNLIYTEAVINGDDFADTGSVELLVSIDR